jgi:hypothetical protein
VNVFEPHLFDESLQLAPWFSGVSVVFPFRIVVPVRYYFLLSPTRQYAV